MQADLDAFMQKREHLTFVLADCIAKEIPCCQNAAAFTQPMTLCSCKTVHCAITSSQSNSWILFLVSMVPTLRAELNISDSVWDILQKLVFEGRREPYVNSHELEKATKPKWNDDQTIKKSNLQWKCI